MSAENPEPGGRPSWLADTEPQMFVEQISRWGPQKYSVWVTEGPMRVSGEYGTYAWTRKQAERKVRRLHRWCQRQRRYEETRREVKP